MPVELRPTQREGIDWLRRTQRGILADEYGLGKTVQAIHAAVLPVLVACPTYLIDQWADAIASERPDDTIAPCHGERWERLAAIATHADWTIINVEMLRTYGDALAGMYGTFIVDEAHHVRGRHAQQSQEAYKIAKRTPNVFLLTATPMVREPDDFFQLLAILDPNRFTSYWKFCEDHCIVVSNGFARTVRGAKDHKQFAAMLKPYLLRRTYKGTGLSKPEAIPYPVRLKPSANWYATYNKLREEYRLVTITFDNAAAMVRTLRRMTFALKLDTVKDILVDNPSTIFYTYFRESAHQVASEFNLPCVTGELAPSERLRIAKQETALVATVSSLKEGVDLTHIRNVCFLEQSYLPGERTQAIARLVRWSKDIRPVGVFDVVVKSTIDTTIERTIARRQADHETILRAELERK